MNLEMLIAADKEALQTPDCIIKKPGGVDDVNEDLKNARKKAMAK